MNFKHVIYFIFIGLLCFSSMDYALQKPVDPDPTVRKYFVIFSTKAILQQDGQKPHDYDLAVYQPIIHRALDRPLGYQVDCSKNDFIAEWKHHVKALHHYHPNGVITIGSNQEHSELMGIQIKKIYEKNAVLHVVFTRSNFEKLLTIQANSFQKGSMPVLNMERLSVKINLNFI